MVERARLCSETCAHRCEKIYARILVAGVARGLHGETDRPTGPMETVTIGSPSPRRTETPGDSHHSYGFAPLPVKREALKASRMFLYMQQFLHEDSTQYFSYLVCRFFHVQDDVLGRNLVRMQYFGTWQCSKSLVGTIDRCKSREAGILKKSPCAVQTCAL